MQQLANGVEVGTDSGLVEGIRGAAFPIQKQGLDNLLTVSIINRLQRGAVAENRNFPVPRRRLTW